MEQTTFKSVKFISKTDRVFGTTVRKRVNEYFKSNNISKTGDYRMWLKVIALPLLYLVPFAIILTGVFSTNLLVFYALWLLMGLGLAGSGLSIMHDACHGSLSKNKALNKFIGSTIMNLACGSSINWKIQHNVLHHSYTNIDGYDEDIDPAGVMRFSPHQEKKGFYKYQVYYAWFFYGLMTLLWATTKDFAQLKRYHKLNLLKAQATTYKKEYTKLIFRKIIYYAIFIALPIVILDISWIHIILGWVSMHFLAGLTLGCIFQPAHVVPTSEFPLPDKNNVVEEDNAIHQLQTTSNFAPTNKILNWYVGGLNFQVEHHLFPNVCHVHLKDISKIVKATAEEFGLPYYSNPTFFGALTNHAKLLYKLGH